MRRMAQAVLENRFGALSPDLMEALNEADEAALIDIVTASYTVGLEGIRMRLGLAGR
jgi:hypothetical protein